VAQAFGTLGCLAPDRIILGVGTGEALNETPATGMEWPAFKERFGRLRESIELIRLLWKEQRVTFDGQYYQTVAATIYDRPARQIPIYIAAAGPTATRLAGRIGDGFITTSGKAPELYRETLIPNLQVGLEKSGRHMEDLDKMIEMKVSFDTDHERALNDTRHWAALALSPEEKTGVEDPEEMEKLADALPVERAASRWIVSTDPEDHIEKIEPYLELGFNHLVFHAPGPDQERFLRLYAKEVLPRLRKKFAIE
jgi:coenzyme F420-dependent glucose-6-phosphate dehydrogenase